MQFKTGPSWKAGYDEERNIYTAVILGGGANIYEINKVIYDALDEETRDEATELIRKGRHLYMEVIDKCGPPYTIVFDKDYKKICPWSGLEPTGMEWPDAMVDAAVDMFESEKNNREQRKQKRAKKSGGKQ